MKNILLILSVLILVSGCGCQWAARNCPDEIIRVTDTVRETIIHDTTFFDTIIQPMPDRIIRLKALAMIDELGYVQMPETTVQDQYGNAISVRIVHDTVYATSINRDSLITVLRSNIRQELRQSTINNQQSTIITKNDKLNAWFWVILILSWFLFITLLIKGEWGKRIKKLFKIIKSIFIN